ncbi:uncharacterized protein EV154DRAFT_534965 [Mucor mucedo]|uniref:uncharacterized protein n=1 Tax=Mucor mucedo TaxID=29922 RepID=UPI00221F9793|nr:uncharacterized protein EV154DRAFT_534965 [Mucor mucedo]KAI7863103.1 hypothetical protein EV154DRAFT_534965 [Mucor mucedo]
MLRQCLKHLQANLPAKQTLVPASKSVTKTRAFPVLYREASTYNNSRSVEIQEEPRTYNRRYVQVDTPFALANKYTYVMPDDAYVASDRVTKILDIGTVDDAADYIKALPIGLQSPIVWNQLIGYCAKHGRANYAEHFFSQMRKRGLEPNERTFTHMLTAFGKSTSPQAVKNAEAWIKRINDFDLKPSTIHMNNLMRVYVNAEQPEKAIEALKQMSTSELVPDAVTYSIALQGCADLNQLDRAEEVRYIWHEIIYRMERNQRSPSGTSALSKKASEIIWKEDKLRKNAKDTELEIDDSLVVSLLSAVTRTAANQKDVLIGIEALDRLYSLCPPSAAKMMDKNHMQRKPGFGFQPSVKVLDAILRFSGGLREYQLGQEYFHLALQQFPRLEPDKFVYDAHAWIEKQLKRRANFEKKRQYQSNRERQ